MQKMTWKPLMMIERFGMKMIQIEFVVCDS
jgi:hypothetical protein